jgi:hypothetical protein
MMPVFLKLGSEFFARLEKIDAAVAVRVAAEGCAHCGGPLHRGFYMRKPRGAAIAAGEESKVRHSLCCGRRGCRKRSLPPSLRFLGRRVYVEAVVLMASICAQVQTELAAVSKYCGVPRITLKRWGAWWRGEFVRSEVWTELRARFVPPPPDEDGMPLTMFDRLASVCGGVVDRLDEVMELTARHLASATTRSVRNGSRFVRDAYAAEKA